MHIAEAVGLYPTTAAKRLTLGIALGSGSTRGWAHVGVLRALAEQGIAPDYIAGCSMGAVVGAALAAGRIEQLETWGVHGFCRRRSRRDAMPRYKVYVGVRGDGDSHGDESIIKVVWAVDGRAAVDAARSAVRKERPEKVHRIWSSNWELYGG